MQPQKVSFSDTLDGIGLLLRRQQYKEALEQTHQLSQMAMQQQLQLILQRFLAELCMECLELSGNFETALQFCEYSLEQYQEHNGVQSTEAQKDRLTLELRKLCLLIKLDRRSEAFTHSKTMLAHANDQQKHNLHPIINRINRYSSGAVEMLTAEQKKIGLFHFSDILATHGAKAITE